MQRKVAFSSKIFRYTPAAPPVYPIFFTLHEMYKSIINFELGMIFKTRINLEIKVVSDMSPA